MKDAVRKACLSAAAFGILLGAAYLRAAAGTSEAAVENPTNNLPPVDVSKVLEAARQSAVDVPSLFLSQEEKIQTVETFVKIVETNSETNDVVSATNGLPRSALRKFVLEKYNPAWLEMWELSVAKRDIRAKWLDLLVVLKNQFPEHASLWASLEKYSNDAVIKDAGWDIMDAVFFTRGDYLEQDAVRDVLKQRLCLLWRARDCL